MCRPSNVRGLTVRQEARKARKARPQGLQVPTTFRGKWHATKNIQNSIRWKVGRTKDKLTYWTSWTKQYSFLRNPTQNPSCMHHASCMITLRRYFVPYNNDIVWHFFFCLYCRLVSLSSIIFRTKALTFIHDINNYDFCSLLGAGNSTDTSSGTGVEEDSSGRTIEIATIVPHTDGRSLGIRWSYHGNVATTTISRPKAL